MPIATRITLKPLSVPLREPFVIATATMTTTRAALVRIECKDGEFGLGEAACLHPVTAEDQADVMSALEQRVPHVTGASFESLADIAGIAAALDESPVARAGLEMALCDALARSRGKMAAELLAEGAPIREHFTSDVTLPILDRAEMTRLARHWYARGFTSFKIKVGKKLSDDLDAIAALLAELSGPSFRVDANGGYRADEAIAFFEHAREMGAKIECFEQPCAREDWKGMAEVARALPVPVIADESVRSLADVDLLADAKACDGVNLKVMKLGGMARAVALGRHARARGLSLMMGGMVETRLGMTGAAHVASALGGVDFVDLDTAFLLAEDPFVGGYRAEGPRLQIYGEGLGVFESTR